MTDKTVVMVTGGAGFIGSAVCRHLIAQGGFRVVNVDKLTYSGCLASLAPIDASPDYVFHQADICDGEAMRRILASEGVDRIMHLAAESHVDRSISGPAQFIDTNIVGTFHLLEATRAYLANMSDPEASNFRFLHVSTDEVYGSLLAGEPAFHESRRYEPNSPYSASKAASDHLVRAYHHTYGIPVLTTNCSNNYGPLHFPEKLIPLMIVNALAGKALPVYGDGQQIRDWLYVKDHCAAIRVVLERGRIGETYNVGGWNEKANIEIVHSVCALLDEMQPRSDAKPYASQISFVTDRPGHDRRYAIDARKINQELGWSPTETFATGLRKTVRWYLDNPKWVHEVQSGAYRDWVAQQYQEAGDAA